MRAVCDVCAAHSDRAAVGVDVDAQGSSLREDESHFTLKGADRLGQPEKGTNSNFRFSSVQTERNSWSPYKCHYHGTSGREDGIGERKEKETR